MGQIFTTPAYEHRDITRPASPADILEMFTQLLQDHEKSEIFVVTGLNHWIAQQRGIINKIVLGDALRKSRKGNTLAFWPGKRAQDVLSAQIPTMEKVLSNDSAFRCLALAQGQEKTVTVLYEHQQIERIGIARLDGHKGPKSPAPRMTQTELGKLSRQCSVIISGYPDDCADRKPLYVISGELTPLENHRLINQKLTIYEPSAELPVTFARTYKLEQGTAVLKGICICSQERVHHASLPKLLSFQSPNAVELNTTFAATTNGIIHDDTFGKIATALINDYDEDLTVRQPMQVSSDNSITLPITHMTMDSETTQTITVPLSFPYDRTASQELHRFNQWADAGGPRLLANIHGVLDNVGLVA